MKYHKILIFILSFILSLTAKGQTVISFEFAMNSLDNPHRFDNSGCYMRFGPNPISINGFNVRAQGALMLSGRGEAGYPGIYMNARGNAKNTVTRHDNNYYNTTLSIEYPFKANKTYQIAMHGLNEYPVWLEGKTKPTNYLIPVFWVKLENDPTIHTSAPNKCDSWFDPVEKKVGRYSKLITDASKSISMRDYTTRFSPLEDRNCVKITYDPSPVDPNFFFDSIFQLHHITITELPYEEEPTRIIASYKNAPRPPRGTPGYDIISEVTSTERGSTTRTLTKKFTINPSQWVSNANGAGYSVYLSDLIPDLSISKLSNIIVYGNATGSPRQPIEQIILPGAFENNNYTYEFLTSGDIVITINNISNTQPSNNVDFALFYN